MFRAAILAAGEGSRLKAAGIATPKALVPVQGTPMIVRLARQLRQAGARETHAIVHPDAERAAALLAAAEIPVRLQLAATAGSFHSLCALLPVLEGEPFLLSLVDSVFDGEELGSFVQQAQASSAEVLLGVTSFVDDESPLRVRIEAGGVVSAVGTSAAESSPYVTGGVYWFGSRLAPWFARARAQGIDRLRHFLSFLVEGGLPVAAHTFRRIVDVDTEHDLRVAQIMEASHP